MRILETKTTFFFILGAMLYCGLIWAIYNFIRTNTWAVSSELPYTVKLMRVSAYCPCELCCGVWAIKGVNSQGERITASGHVIQPGDQFIAAPPQIPFGTLLLVPGYADGFPVPVLDRGGAVKGNRIDVFFDNHQTALEWGVQKLKVRILER